MAAGVAAEVAVTVVVVAVVAVAVVCSRFYIIYIYVRYFLLVEYTDRITISYQSVY